jgi:hypothetical protein
MPKIDLLFITYSLVYNTTLGHEVILDPPVEGGNGKERRGSGSGQQLFYYGFACSR